MACSDGTVKIISIPHPEILKENMTGLAAFKVKACMILDRASEGIRNHNCLCMDWSKTDGHTCLVAGFSDGMYAF
jgi:hypothetical protein